MAGVFITFEGGDGSGKSTQVAKLAETLRQRGLAVVATREPGGTPIAEKIRKVLLDPENHEMGNRTEALLFAAGRADHVHHLIRPAIARGEIVISDRFMDSSVVYQGMGRGLGVSDVMGLNMWATDNLKPDLTIVLDVESNLGLDRIDTKDRIEQASIEMHQKVRQGFLQLASTDPDRYLVINAAFGIDEIAALVLERVDALLLARS